MTEEEMERLDLDVERLGFLHECRARLDLIDRGYLADPKGTRAAELEALIERHEHFSWLDPSVPVAAHHQVDRGDGWRGRAATSEPERSHVGRPSGTLRNLWRRLLGR